MGVPSFYRWLLDRFPLSVVDAVVGKRNSGDGKASGPNPNGIEFDNLYLDLNGIIHPCFHPEGKPAPESYDEVFQAIFLFIDRLVWIVRPRKLLYLAIDGVAPRAKMNQQRSRRFRAAKDAETEEDGLGNKLELNENSTTSKLDSNVITPGTEFMELLSSALRYIIRKRMNDNYLVWRGIKVILSDSSVPGEGEHKIMSYIRLQRNLPGYDPNTRHCLYGLDADLIMLALATHEIHFSILREDLQKAGANVKSSSELSTKEKSLPFLTYMNKFINEQKFQFLHVWILREYLAYALKIPDQTVNQDLERLIDDFVFMCLFVGNDFLPHMPSLEIPEGAIDLLMEIYKKEFVRMGGHLTYSFEVNLERVNHFLQAVGYHECAILRKRMRGNISQERKESKKRVQGPPSSKVSSSSAPITKDDEIEYGEKGWKERYYAVKCDAETEEDRERIKKDMVLKYTEGICWVMHYYYEGVCSWQWFYPYHYAPFCTDFHDIFQSKVQFTLGKPFKPFDQLMAVLPAASAHALPSAYRELMTDKLSPLAPFYPTDFKLDMNGKRFSWQAICKLPFIEESLLLPEIARVEHTLTDEERQRNSFGLDVLFIYRAHPLAEDIISLHASGTDHQQLTMTTTKIEINPELSGGMNGYVVVSDKPLIPVEIDSPIDGMKRIKENEVLSMFYEFPPFHPHVTKPPEGVKLPSKSIRKKDVQLTPCLWHEKITVVGRLHSISSIPHSISGCHLAKLARQLVSRWYLEKGLKISQSMQHGVVNTDGILSCENTKTVCTIDAIGDGESIGSKHRDTEMVASCPFNASTAETLSISNNGGGQLASILNSGEKVCAGEEMVISSKSKKKRLRKKRARLASDTMNSVSVQTPVSTTLKSTLEDTISAVLNESTCQLHINQINGDKNGIEGGSGKCIIQNDHSRADVLSCHSNSENRSLACEAQGEKIIAAVVLKDPVKGYGDGNVVPENNVREVLKCTSSMEGIHVGDTKTDGSKSTKNSKRKRKARVASDNIDTNLGMMSLTATKTHVPTALTSKLGDTMPALLDESICQSQVDQIGGDRNNIEGEAGKSIIIPNEYSSADVLSPPLSLERSLSGEKSTEVVSSFKDNGEGIIVVPENANIGGELMNSSLVEAICVGGFETNGNTGDAGNVGKSRKKRKRKERGKTDNRIIVENVGTMSPDAMHTPAIPVSAGFNRC